MASLIQTFYDNVEKHSVHEKSLLPNKKSDPANRLQCYANYFRKYVSLQCLKEKTKTFVCQTLQITVLDTSCFIPNANIVNKNSISLTDCHSSIQQ